MYYVIYAITLQLNHLQHLDTEVFTHIRSMHPKLEVIVPRRLG